MLIIFPYSEYGIYLAFKALILSNKSRPTFWLTFNPDLAKFGLPHDNLGKTF